MHKPRFGIDIDGTVTTPDTLLPHINKAYNVSLTLDDVTEYDFLSAFPHPVDRQEFAEWFLANERHMYEVSTIYPDAKAILDEWHKKYELIYISARHDGLVDVTTDWFAKQQVPYDRIELIGSHDKLRAAKEAAVEIFLEDKHDNAVMLAEQLDIPVILFDTPYNRLTTPKQVIRVNSWRQADDWIKRNF